MLRAAAKNHNDVTVVVNADDYQRVLDEMAENDGTPAPGHPLRPGHPRLRTHRSLRPAIANYLGSRVENRNEPARFPRTFNGQFEKLQDMRYGENPHQQAAFYRERGATEASVSTAQQTSG